MILALLLLLTGSVHAATTQGFPVSLGNAIGKTVVYTSSSAATAAVNATIVLSSRTTTVGKTFYLQHIDAVGFLAVPSSATVVNMGVITFQSPTGTAIDSMTFVNSQGAIFGTWQVDFAEPIPFASQVTLSVNVKANTATAVNWLSTIVGYEK